jgi:ATP-binding cassette subfamily F protein uup
VCCLTSSSLSNKKIRDINFNIAAGSRVGLIGVNGVGKSTFMKCLAGIEKPDTGTVGVEGRPHILYVEQEPVRSSGDDGAEWTVADALTEPMAVGSSAASPKAARVAGGLLALRSFWAASNALEANNNDNDKKDHGGTNDQADDAVDNLATSMAAMDECGGWELETILETVATKLGLAGMKGRAVRSLSGGERKRVALASALAQQPDVILLDEPTNHLDWLAIDWLADFLTGPSSSKAGGQKMSSGSGSSGMSLLLVTHDRYYIFSSRAHGITPVASHHASGVSDDTPFFFF